ncbi:hypothetical protein GSI_03545 [Ganoderma sinense ZZ0214-1]|uniref:Peptidase A1 domain-containing protein n=1 Tax=Ganoderma sinense ZZ0214-1 TaxID=1077348 RepID=A0A2G8SJA0_9APHY|nr:hypothetical protein GSI_03545 [Ganoderma sinense ZZ0214-1]
MTAGNFDVDTSDIWYAVEITVGGQNFTVQLDTRSSDLWLHTAGHTVDLTNITDLKVAERYGRSYVEGRVEFADVQIAGLSIQNQTFVHVTDEGVHGFDLAGYDGILGMAFDEGSIHAKVRAAWGAEAADTIALSPLSALFAQAPLLPNNFDIQLSRPVPELAGFANGTFYISSYARHYTNVADAPRLPRVVPEHWSVVMDEMLVNGQSFALNQSVVANVTAGKVVAALDMARGASLPTLPPAAIDAIYGSVPGAVRDNVSERWLVPCDSSPNLTFVFGGQHFAVHPLDLTFPVTATLSINGWDTDVTACTNTFQPLTRQPTSADGYDIVLANSFFHNAYISFNYAEWTPTNRTGTSTPYVQMVSTTDGATMWDEFHRNRTASLARLPLPLDPALIAQYDAGYASTAPTSPTTTTTATAMTTSSESPSGPTQDPDKLAAIANLSGTLSTDAPPSTAGGDSWGSKYGTAVLALLAVILALCVALLTVMVAMCVRGSKERRRSGSGSGSGAVGLRYAPVPFKDSEPVEDNGRGSVVSSD